MWPRGRGGHPRPRNPTGLGRPPRPRESLAVDAAAIAAGAASRGRDRGATPPARAPARRRYARRRRRWSLARLRRVVGRPRLGPRRVGPAPPRRHPLSARPRPRDRRLDARWNLRLSVRRRAWSPRWTGRGAVGAGPGRLAAPVRHRCRWLALRSTATRRAHSRPRHHPRPRARCHEAAGERRPQRPPPAPTALRPVRAGERCSSSCTPSRRFRFSRAPSSPRRWWPKRRAWACPPWRSSTGTGSMAPRACLDRLVGIFGRSNCFVEVQRHFDREEERTLEGLVGLARAARVPLVATNQPLYARPGGGAVADVFTCIREKTDLDHAGRQLAVNGERGLRAETEMARVFRDLPEALHATGELALRLGFTLKDLGYRFPDYPRPPGQSPHRHFEELVAAGVRQRYGTGPLAARARRQVAHELSIIGRLDLAGYFLIVWDIVEFCRANNILVQGRGSAANSAVCYALGITAVDPIKMDLLFERFLSEARGEWPDIDLDLPSGERREGSNPNDYHR